MYFFLDVTPKSRYPGRFELGVPIYKLNGKYDIFFHITSFNYGLGLIENYLQTGEGLEDIETLMISMSNAQSSDGSWYYRIPKDSGHLLSLVNVSGMTQALGISFFIRCSRLGLISRADCLLIVSKAMGVMTSSAVSTIVEVDSKSYVVIEEFYSSGSCELNGFVFALFALYDYGNFTNDFKLFDNYLISFKGILKKYNFFFWSYYNLNRKISSRFYHELHINMLKVLSDITGDIYIENYRRRWEYGSYFYIIFVPLKALQKLFGLSSLIVNDN
jgi:hypothetical protein